MTERWLHFAGVAGSGMSALAQFHSLRGGTATGSDRFFDRGDHPELRARLESVGIEIVPQDGSVFELGAPTALVVSTAVEDSVPDVAAARQHGVPILHRSELLAQHVDHFRTLAITGTSGKSTVTAMLFEILRTNGLDPSVLSGAELACLEGQPGMASVAVGTSEWLVIEADESDGSLTRYRPWLGLVLNLQRDHKEPVELAPLFQTFRKQTYGPFLAGDDPALDFLGEAIRFGFEPTADVRAIDIGLERDRSRFRVTWGTKHQDHSPFDRGDFLVDLPVPGRHNTWNAVAAAAAALEIGMSGVDIARGLRGYQGVSRRFQFLGVAGGIEVIDDFAHNPKKIEAALETAQNRSTRVLAVFQPHGFGPTRFIREELIDVLAATLRPDDIFWFLDIFYAGGTAQQDLSSQDLVQDLLRRGRNGRYAVSREALANELAREARNGDVVLVMGARDPSLPALGRRILGVLGAVR